MTPSQLRYLSWGVMSLFPDWKVMPSLLIRRVNLCGLVGDYCLTCWSEQSNLCYLVGRNTTIILSEGVSCEESNLRGETIPRLKVELTSLSDSRSYVLAFWLESCLPCWLEGSSFCYLMETLWLSLFSYQRSQVLVVLWSAESSYFYLIKSDQGALSSAIWLRIRQIPHGKKNKVGTNQIKWGSLLWRIESTGRNDSSS